MSSRRVDIPVAELLVRPFEIWDRGWFLLSSGDLASGRFNTMTVSWGFFGTVWNRPVAQVLVRPTRHTFGFMEEHDDFTLCAFPESSREALRLLGTLSGRDGDKIAASGLHPEAALRVSSPAFSEAELIVECRKIHSQDLDPSRFIDSSIGDEYPRRDYHRIYLGEILAVSGLASYRGA